MGVANNYRITVSMFFFVLLTTGTLVASDKKTQQLLSKGEGDIELLIAPAATVTTPRTYAAQTIEALFADREREDAQYQRDLQRTKRCIRASKCAWVTGGTMLFTSLNIGMGVYLVNYMAAQGCIQAFNV